MYLVAWSLLLSSLVDTSARRNSVTECVGGMGHSQLPPIPQLAGEPLRGRATRETRKDVKRVFLESAIEEHSHCREYYAVADTRLGVSTEDVKRSVPLPANLAFDHKCLDWQRKIGLHTSVGYFQESTANYYSQCERFYEIVESNYGLPRFFDGWKGHIRLDLDYGHASAFGDALESTEHVSAAQLRGSLTNAAITVQTLVAALDQILACDRADGAIILRLPQDDSGAFGDGGHQAFVSSQVLNSIINSAEQIDFLNADLAESCCRALSYASTEGELVSLGRLVELSAQHLQRKVGTSSWFVPDMVAASIANFIREASIYPRELGLSLLYLLDRVNRNRNSSLWILEPAARAELHALVNSTNPIGVMSLRAATRLMQFAELLDQTPSLETERIRVDILR